MKPFWSALPMLALLCVGCTDPLAGRWRSFGSAPNVGRYLIDLDDDLVGTLAGPRIRRSGLR